MVVLWLLAFVVSVAILVYGADVFVDKSEKIALHLGVSSFVVGVTVVAMGTSLPELVTTLFALFESGSSEQNILRYIPLESIIGSNIANILIVIGISAIVAKKIKVDNNLIESDIPLLCIFTGIFILFLYPDASLSSTEGALSLVLFLVFLAYGLKTRFKNRLLPFKKVSIEKGDIPILVLSVVGIALGGHFTIVSIQNIVVGMGWNNTGVLVLILLALGTSFPEIAVSVQAARKKKFELAIGNVFGSNVFNMFLVGGVGTLFGTLHMSLVAMVVGIPFLILATLSFLFTAQDDHIGYWEGVGLISVYGVFVLRLIGVV